MQAKSKTLKVQHVSEIPGHSMFNDWALPDRTHSFLPFNEFVPKLHAGRVPREIEFDQICAKPNYWFGTDDFKGSRFDRADPKYPGMVVRDMPNPCNLPFRMIDGRRRMEKLKRAGKITGPFVVFDYAEIEPFILDFELIE